MQKSAGLFVSLGGISAVEAKQITELCRCGNPPCLNFNGALFNPTHKCNDLNYDQTNGFGRKSRYRRSQSGNFGYAYLTIGRNKKKPHRSCISYGSGLGRRKSDIDLRFRKNRLSYLRPDSGYRTLTSLNQWTKFSCSMSVYTTGSG